LAFDATKINGQKGKLFCSSYKICDPYTLEKFLSVPYSPIPVKKNKKLMRGIWVAGFPFWFFYMKLL